MTEPCLVCEVISNGRVGGLPVCFACYTSEAPDVCLKLQTMLALAEGYMGNPRDTFTGGKNVNSK